MFLCHALPIVDKIIFRCFWMSCFVCIVFTLCRYLFSLPSFARTSWFISSSCTVFFFSFVFSILFPYILGSFCFTIFACFRRFFIWVSSRTSHPGLDCFFVLFEGTPIDICKTLDVQVLQESLISCPHRHTHTHIYIYIYIYILSKRD